MSRRLVSVLLVAGFVAFGLIRPTTADAAGPIRFFPKLHAALHHQGSLHGESNGTHGSHFYPDYNTGNYPRERYGVPTYNWGYFGAHYRPTIVSHKGYYGKCTQWGYRSGY